MVSSHSSPPLPVASEHEMASVASVVFVTSVESSGAADGGGRFKLGSRRIASSKSWFACSVWPKRS